MLNMINMEKTSIGVRDVNEDIFRRFRAMAIEERLRLGDALSKAMEKMLKEKKEKHGKKLNFLLEIKPFDFGKGSEKTSLEIDKILYEKGE